MSLTPQAFYLFDSTTIRHDEAFGRYHDLYAVGSDVRYLGPQFHARLKACRLGPVVLFDRRLDGVSHERDAARVRRDGFAHFTLQLVVSGRMTVEHGGGAREAGPGHIAVFDLTRPQRTTAHGVHLLTFSVPRALVERSTPHVAALHGRVLDGPGAGLLGDVMLSIMTRQLGGDAVDPAPVVRVLEAALALALSAGDAAALRADETGDVLERVRLVVEANLARRDLSPALVSRLAGVSRTVLYDLFKPVGGVAAHIQERRVVRLRSLIQGGDHRGASIAQLAFQAGFASDSHANRSFARMYGTTPGRFRSLEAGRRAEMEAGRRAEMRDLRTERGFNAWLRAIN